MSIVMVREGSCLLETIKPGDCRPAFNFKKWLRGLDLNQRPSGYEPVGQTLSLVVSVALTPATAKLYHILGGFPCPSLAQLSGPGACQTQVFTYIEFRIETI